MKSIFLVPLFLFMTACGGGGGGSVATPGASPTDPSLGNSGNPNPGGGGGTTTPQYFSGQQWSQDFYAMPINFANLSFQAANYRTGFCMEFTSQFFCWDNGRDPSIPTSLSFWGYPSVDPAQFIATLWNPSVLVDANGYTDVDVMTHGFRNTATCTVANDLQSALCKVSLNDPQAFTIDLN